MLHVSLRAFTAELILQADNVVDDVDKVCSNNTSVHLAEQHVGHRDFISTTIGDLYDDLKMAVSGAVNIVHTEGDVPRALELAKAVAPPRSSNCKTSEDDAPSPLNDGSAPFKATPQVGMRVTAVDYDGTWLNGVIVSQTLHGAFVQTECGKLYGAEWKDVQLLCEFTDEAVATF